jgi:hypothetical protein
MSVDQNQHYLTQSYQRGWLNAGRVHVYRWAHNKLVCEPKSTKSTGERDGLYFIPMAPLGKQNIMEDVFWKRIDQWGADGLALLRTNDPAAAAKINKDRLATFVMSSQGNVGVLALLTFPTVLHLLVGQVEDGYVLELICRKNKANKLNRRALIVMVVIRETSYSKVFQLVSDILLIFEGEVEVMPICNDV